MSEINEDDIRVILDCILTSVNQVSLENQKKLLCLAERIRNYRDRKTPVLRTCDSCKYLLKLAEFCTRCSENFESFYEPREDVSRTCLTCKYRDYFGGNVICRKSIALFHDGYYCKLWEPKEKEHIWNCWCEECKNGKEDDDES